MALPGQIRLQVVLMAGSKPGTRWNLNQPIKKPSIAEGFFSHSPSLPDV
jgi:hypothetical protein